MKKAGIYKWLFEDRFGVSYGRIWRYFYPEFITALIIYFLPQFIDCYFICNLKSTELYAISGIVENFLGMFTKCAEGLLIGTVIISGYFNGLHEYKKAGQAFVDAFWITIGVSFCVSLALYFGVFLFYRFNNFSSGMIAIGVPYLQMKAIGVFFLFFYFSLVGFFRAVKNTFTPMVIFAIGSLTFVLCDYLLIFGKCGFPQLGLLGSAVAYLIQYVLMSCLMLSYILYVQEYKKYAISLAPRPLDKERIKRFFLVSYPVVLDKMSIAFAYVWLGACMSKLGSTAGASFSMIKLMERIAFVPAIAFSQIITFLVSNDLGRGQWDDIHANIKKVALLSSVMVGTILLFGSLWPQGIVKFYGCNREICSLVSAIFPSLSILVMFDLLQLILSGALRGAGDVQTVMVTRLSVILGYFIPMTFIIDLLPLHTLASKMLTTYAVFLIGNGLMTIVYIFRLKQAHWKKQNI